MPLTQTVSVSVSMKVTDTTGVELLAAIGSPIGPAVNGGSGQLVKVADTVNPVAGELKLELLAEVFVAVERADEVVFETDVKLDADEVGPTEGRVVSGIKLLFVPDEIAALILPVVAVIAKVVEGLEELQIRLQMSGPFRPAWFKESTGGSSQSLRSKDPPCPDDAYKPASVAVKSAAAIAGSGKTSMPTADSQLRCDLVEFEPGSPESSEYSHQRLGRRNIVFRVIWKILATDGRCVPGLNDLGRVKCPSDL